MRMNRGNYVLENLRPISTSLHRFYLKPGDAFTHFRLHKQAMLERNVYNNHEETI